ncbi:hypothetical protein CONLIGDRAFT_648960 [Coniochaeta ligniaria NRRL 30616]|uniref:Uncharacterized protein n=1 Tax=Coniochaeta ligniaria NRRL 30616 TaxID=1408157 RepID=A0A1J7I939_9PEZI|nr:hypothetical protein CONLIGDRAFT_648960 [Coniochaeta ligniaria NRRL 30616]
MICGRSRSILTFSAFSRPRINVGRVSNRTIHRSTAVNSNEHKILEDEEDGASGAERGKNAARCTGSRPVDTCRRIPSSPGWRPPEEDHVLPEIFYVPESPSTSKQIKKRLKSSTSRAEAVTLLWRREEVKVPAGTQTHRPRGHSNWIEVRQTASRLHWRTRWAEEESPTNLDKLSSEVGQGRGDDKGVFVGEDSLMGRQYGHDVTPIQDATQDNGSRKQTARLLTSTSKPLGPTAWLEEVIRSPTKLFGPEPRVDLKTLSIARSAQLLWSTTTQRNNWRSWTVISRR